MSTETDSDLIGDLLNELETARGDLRITRELLSVALEQLAELTTRSLRQTATIRRLLGERPPEPPSYEPLGPLPDVNVPDGMVRACEIRWTAADVR